MAHPINDYFDREADKIGKPKAPLVTGVISLNEAKVIILLNYLIAIILIAIIPPNEATRIFAIIMLFLTYGYSAPPFRFAGRGIYGNIFVSGAIFVPFLGGWVAVKGWTYDPIVLLITAAYLAFAISIKTVLDIVDVVGDKRAGRVTVPLQIGRERAYNYTVYSVAFAILSFLAVYLTGVMNIIYIPVIIVAAIIVYVTLTNLKKDFGEKTGRKYSEMFMFPSILFSIAVIVGSVPFGISPLTSTSSPPVPVISYSIILVGIVVSMVAFSVVFFYNSRNRS